MNSNKQETILLMAPDFFGYDEQIKRTLILQGYLVDVVHFEASGYVKTILHLLQKKKNYNSQLHKWWNHKVLSLVRNDFNYIIVIGGRNLNTDALKTLRKNHLKENGKMILYLWDSIENLAVASNVLNEYDALYSFDSEDCLKYNMRLLPLFYNDDLVEEAIAQNPSVRYDLGYVGSFSLYRYKITDFLKQYFPDMFDYQVISAKAAKRYLWRKKYREVNKLSLRYNPLSQKEVCNYLNICKCILDIPSPTQSGLSMRTFEALALKKKLITTNRNIVQYDFYNPNNIYIIDPHDLIPPSKEWIGSSFDDSESDEFKNYSLSSWTSKLLSEL